MMSAMAWVSFSDRVMHEDVSAWGSWMKDWGQDTPNIGVRC